VEVLVRVADPAVTAELDAMLSSALDPATRCWVLEAGGSWSPSPSAESTVRDHQVQEILRHRKGG
jgi:polyphosphate kinase